MIFWILMLFIQHELKRSAEGAQPLGILAICTGFILKLNRKIRRWLFTDPEIVINQKLRMEKINTITNDELEK